MPTNTTAGRGYQLPHQSNPLEVDVYRIIAAFEAIDVDIVALFTAVATKASDTAVVKLLGDQTIAGIKTLTSSPLFPTASAGDNTTKAATTAFVQTAIASLVDSSPAALDTLNELAAALGDDPNFATTISTALGLKAPLASPAFTGTPTAPTAAAGTSTTQLATTAFVAAALGVAVPSGVVVPYAGSAAPTGWMLCAGQAVSRTTYAELFTAIGTTYGTGDGSTTFNLPDLRGRTVAGKDNMNGTAANRLTSGGSGVNGSTLGATGGAETHTLTTGQMPSHSHDYIGGSNAAGSGTVGAAGQSANGYVMITQSSGGGGAHNNVQPTIVLNYLIKT